MISSQVLLYECIIKYYNKKHMLAWRINVLLKRSHLPRILSFGFSNCSVFPNTPVQHELFSVLNSYFLPYIKFAHYWNDGHRSADTKGKVL